MRDYIMEILIYSFYRFDDSTFVKPKIEKIAEYINLLETEKSILEAKVFIYEQAMKNSNFKALIVKEKNDKKGSDIK